MTQRGSDGAANEGRKRMGLQGDKLVCDSCQTVVSGVVNPPAEGWPNLHVLCSSCFAQLGAKTA
jgi:hypothetical protein